jgi:hypothetical protein
MAPLHPDLDRLGDDLQAAAERTLAARRARRAAIRRGIVVAMVTVLPAVLMMPGVLAPFQPATLSSISPQAEPVWDDLATDEANVAVGTRFASDQSQVRLRPISLSARVPHLGARWNRPWPEPRAR